MFKQHLNHTSNRLHSWITGDGDCCKWAGVVCDNITGHVLELHLGNPYTEVFTSDGSESRNEKEAEIDAFVRSRMGGKLNPSLLDLKHLNYLDLSYNDFRGIRIPRFLASMESLTYLNLTRAGFSGMIPHQFGNLSNLRYLDLSKNSFSAENLFWLSSLPLLEHLDLSRVNLSKASDWLLEINTLPSLKVLKLASCELQHFPPLSIVNFSALVTLDLSANEPPLIPSWVFGLSHLHFLDMGFNEIQGPIPDGLQNLTSLTHLDLYRNHFNSSIPTWLYSLTHLQHLSLSGQLPVIYSISGIDLSNNKFSGSIFHFVCHRMHELREIEFLKLRGNFFSKELPDCWKIWPFLKILNLGNNKFTDNLPISFGTLSELRTLRLRKNNLSGTIPSSLGNCTELETLDIGENELVGTIPIWIEERFLSMLILNLRSNKFHGSIPRELCNLASLQILDLADNNLSGVIPRCISNISVMVTVNSSSVRNSILYSTRYSDFIEDVLLVVKGKIAEYNTILNLVRSIDLSKNKFS
ncbi:hypothetical protein Ddye_027456 [Dipteronia dyeriana]|uniref:Leucine-rich repeat-containing N-terminal plant-type domain-containing protein n=1 Tax=Dipteronia dyeriana TaxID=168575 RepID=A0AAD9WQH9_9ROSI|nr:hypothetical protein Ddye_027456 [Dipteronia dyeriana]